MDEYEYGGTRDAAARALGQEAARSFAGNPVEGASMESFVLGDVTADVIRLTRESQQAQQSKIKAWRRRHFVGPIALAVIGLVVAITTTPRQGTGGSSAVSALGAVGMLAGVIWFIVIAVRASSRFAEAQQAREAETGRLLEIARHAAAVTYRELADAPAASPTTTPTTAPTQQQLSMRFSGAPAPAGQPFGVTQGGAGQLIAAWMRHLGESDAAASTHALGGSFDVAGSRHVAKFINNEGPVEAVHVRELATLAAADGRGALFFAAGSYGVEAVELAEQAGVALFTYDAVEGTLNAANAAGEKALSEGL
jgi:hypothetical protein